MPQQKKTEAFDVGELPDLTEQQMAFVKGVLDGQSASDAFRAAYNCENTLPESVWAMASRLRHNVKVVAWLDAARMAKLGSARLTLDNHMQELERLRELAVKTGNYGAAVQAEQIRGKVAGHHIERIEDVTQPRDPVQTLKEIAAASPDGPDIAARLAAQYRIPWTADEGATKH